ncbi:MAG: hypothetical protein PVJ53_03495 [Desulfobacterales bacterium]|jgi:hypothetical protein
MRFHRRSFLSLFPERRLFFAVVCFGGILGFYLLSILPHQQAADQIEAQIAALETQIGEQKLLGPIYHQYTRLLGEMRLEGGNQLAFPAPERLTAEQVAGIEPLLRQLAAQSQLKVGSIGADLNSMLSETGELKLSLDTAGTTRNLRGFMLKLGELPYLTHVERIEVRRRPGQQALQMEMDIWLARQ